MNEDLQYIDGVVKNTLNNMKIVSNDDAWDKLDKKMSSRHSAVKNTFRPYYFTAAIVLIIAAIYGFFLHDQLFIQTNKSQTAQKLQTEQIEQQSATTDSNLMTTENNDESKETANTFTIEDETQQQTFSFNIKKEIASLDLTDSGVLRNSGIVSNNDLMLSTDEQSNSEKLNTIHKQNSTTTAQTEKISNQENRETKAEDIRLPVAIENSSNPKEGCLPLTIDFEANTLFANSYLWEFGNGDFSTEKNPKYTYYHPGTYIVKLKATGDNGIEILVRFDTVTVYEKPRVDFKLPLENEVATGKPVRFKNYTENASHYRWHFGDGSTSNHKNPVHTYNKQGTYDISLAVWSAHQCFDSLTIMNAIKTETKYVLEFPDAFTPDKNGPNGGYYTNDKRNCSVFYPLHKGVIEYHLIIFNRSGAKVFETNDISIGWNGYYENTGKLCPFGVYVYKAKAVFDNGEVVNKQGNVTLTNFRKF